MPIQLQPRLGAARTALFIDCCDPADGCCDDGCCDEGGCCEA